MFYFKSVNIRSKHMGLFEFFFPAESQAMSMKRMSENQSKMMRSQQRRRLPNLKSKKPTPSSNELKSRVRELENDLGFLALMISGIVTKLDQSDVVHKEDLKEILEELDGFDGVVDGKLDINILRGQTHN